VTITLKINVEKELEKEWTTLNSEERNFTTLEAFARKAFKIELANLEFFNKTSRIKTDADVAVLEHKCIVTVRNKQVPFSSITKIESAMQFTGCKNKMVLPKDFPKKEALTLDDAHVKHAIDSIRYLSDLVDIPEGCETTRRLYIDPILCAAGLKVGDIKMLVEKTVESPDLIGDVDYVFTFNDVVICVTEGKRDNLDAGIAQNIAQLSALRSARKRKHAEISRCSYFGIATTFVEWVFIEVGDGKVCRSNMSVVDPSKPESIRDIIAQIVGLLKICKEESKTRKREHDADNGEKIAEGKKKQNKRLKRAYNQS
jgi:hypothetical protein